MLQTEATLGFVTSLSGCDQLSKNVYCLNPVPVPGDHDQYGWSEMRLPKAAGKADIWQKCGYRGLLGRLISDILSRDRQLPMAAQFSYCFAMREAFSRGA